MIGARTAIARRSRRREAKVVRDLGLRNPANRPGDRESQDPGWLAMRLEYVPLLGMQRDLYRIPRGLDRFRAYARTMGEDDRDDSRVAPLVALNPLAKGHVVELIEALLRLDAEGLASETAAEASA